MNEIEMLPQLDQFENRLIGSLNTKCIGYEMNMLNGPVFKLVRTNYLIFCVCVWSSFSVVEIRNSFPYQ